MNLRQIEVFHAVMSTGSVTSAAVELRISQPAVSQTIKSVEAMLGFTLFERRNGKFQPTPEAHELYGEAKSLHRAIGNIRRTASELTRRHGDAVELLVSPCLASSLLPPALMAYRQKYPNVRLSCEPLGYRALVEKLHRSQADIGVALGCKQEELLDSVRVGRVRLVCALPHSHPLAERAEVTPDDLAAENLISFHRESAIGQEVEDAFRSAGRKIQTSITVPFGSTAIELVRVGLGVAVVDELTASSGVHNLAIRSFAPERSLDVAVTYRSDRLPSKQAKALIDVIKVQARTIIGWRKRRLELSSPTIN